ncbi:MAG: LysR family transcriptional regulator [Clostridia bacterium]|nr:LysR family transcriptional regulator [Clostridia bacterium]MBQ6865991.1 LysR family transcriptional regulator [Clostridia bacterium]MBQ9324068.1 LysR family transcriptional regulator [Clostridia bacterium]MBR0422821.1 LysR family transcriptional regulator [Clostridia bacterium]
MNLRSLEYFLVVTEEMNFTRAAERLFITQQALSSHIQRLEAEYDAELFHRKPVLALTQKGEELRYWAQQILSAEKALRANLHDISINCRGRIRIGIARLRANAMMPDIMERYRKTYPNVTIELLHGSTDQLQNMLLENKVDMYVGVNVETGMNEVRVPLVEEEIWGCTSQSFFREQFSEESEMQHFLANERDIRTIHGLPLLVTLPSNRIRRQLDKYYLDGGVRPYIYFESESQLLLYELARRSMGLAVISPIALFDRQQELDGMISFPICHSLQKNAMSLVYRRDDPMPQFARDFITVTEEVSHLYVKSLKLLTANVTQYSRQFD